MFTNPRVRHFYYPPITTVICLILQESLFWMSLWTLENFEKVLRFIYWYFITIILFQYSRLFIYVRFKKPCRHLFLYEFDFLYLIPL